VVGLWSKLRVYTMGLPLTTCVSHMLCMIEPTVTVTCVSLLETDLICAIFGSIICYQIY
jgi:hypothetical protein